MGEWLIESGGGGGGGQILYTLGGRRLATIYWLYRYDVIEGCGRVQSTQYVDAFHNEIGQNVKFSTKKAPSYIRSCLSS